MQKTVDKLSSISVANRSPTLQSPVPHLLVSNCNPSPTEIQQIHKAILEAELGRALLHFEAVMRRTKESIKTRRRSLQEFIDAHQAILAPWKRLPPELLALVFLFSQVPGLETLAPIRRLPTVSQVCRRWREVALSSPALWTEIVLDCRKDTSRATWSRYIDCMLQRSRECPLKVYIALTQNRHISHPSVESLISHSHRWSVAKICCTSSTIHAIQRLHRKLPSLHSLELIADNTEVFSNKTINAFEVAPALRQVCIRGEWFPTTFSIPWPQLTFYQDDQRSKSTKKAPLSSLTALKELHITWTRSRMHENDPKTTLNDLEKLTIDFVSYRGVLEKLIIPNIKEITILNHRSNPMIHIRATLSRSWFSRLPYGIHLRKFTCHSEFRDPGDLTSLFPYVPGIQELDISLPPASDIGRMLILPDCTPVATNLVALNFQVLSSLGDRGPYVRDLARNRCEWIDGERPPSLSKDKRYKQVRRLRSFTITFLKVYQSLEERELIEYPYNDVSADEVDIDGAVVRSSWRRELSKFSPASPSLPPGSSRSKELVTLDEVFRSMEGTEVTEVRHLYVS